jgi:hypothetical protein
MTTEYTPVNQNNATIVLPSNGESASVASIIEAVKDVADNSAYVKARAPGASGATLHVPLNSALYNCHKDGSTGVHWATNNGTTYNSGCWIQTDVAEEGLLGFDITSLLSAAGLLGGTITGYSMQLDGDLYSGTPPHAAKPGTMPIVRITTIALATGARATPATMTDDSATQAVYDADHTVVGTCSVATDGAHYRYILEVLGECGTNSEVGLTLKDLTVTVSHA